MMTDSAPLISVVVPIYNAGRYLKMCIESILLQTYRKLEIILVDDDSTDNSLDLCRQYAETEDRIRVIHKEHGGLVRARKTGVSSASGDYITFVDADDWIDPDTYEKAVGALKETESDMILYGLIEEYEDISVERLNDLPEGYYCKDEITERILPYMLCNQTFFQYGILPNLFCKLIRSDLLKEVQCLVSDEVEIGEDVDCTFQMMLQADSLKILNILPYHYRKRYDSTLWNQMPLEQCKKLYRDLKRVFLEHEKREQLMDQLYRYMLFIMLLKASDRFISYKAFRNCFASKRIILYGAGGFGQEIYRTVTENRLGEIRLWVDQRYQVYQKQGLPVCEVEKLFSCEYDSIFIAVLNTEICKKISDYLVEKGISEERISYFSPSEEYVQMLVNILEDRDGISQ